MHPTVLVGLQTKCQLC